MLDTLVEWRHNVGHSLYKGADVLASNGVIHIIDTVMLPPAIH